MDAAGTTANQQARLTVILAAQIFQAKAADCSIRQYCSFRRLSPFHDIPGFRLPDLLDFIRHVRHNRVMSRRRRFVCSRFSTIITSMLCSSLNCMPSRVLVGRQLPAGLFVQHGGAR